MVNDVGVSRHVELSVYLVWEENYRDHIEKDFMTVTDWFCQNYIT